MKLFLNIILVIYTVAAVYKGFQAQKTINDPDSIEHKQLIRLSELTSKPFAKLVLIFSMVIGISIQFFVGYALYIVIQSL